MQVEQPNESILNASYEFICICLTCYFIVSVILIFTNSLWVLVIYLAVHYALLRFEVFKRIPKVFHT